MDAVSPVHTLANLDHHEQIKRDAVAGFFANRPSAHRREHQPREHAVPCQHCRRPTFSVTADCGCTTGRLDLIG